MAKLGSVYCTQCKRLHKIGTIAYDVHIVKRGHGKPIKGEATEIPVKREKIVKSTEGQEYCNECKRLHKVSTKRYLSHLRKGWIKGKETEKRERVRKEKQHRKRESKVYRSPELLAELQKRRSEGWNWCVICNKTKKPKEMSTATKDPYCKICYELVKEARKEGRRVFVETEDTDEGTVYKEVEPVEGVIEKPKRSRKQKTTKKKSKKQK